MLFGKRPRKCLKFNYNHLSETMCVNFYANPALTDRLCIYTLNRR